MKTPRGAAMSQKMRKIKAENPTMRQQDVMSMASRELSGNSMPMMTGNGVNGGFLPLLLSGLAGAILPKLLGAFTGNGMTPKRGKGMTLSQSGRGMYLKPYR